jgi:DegV family protein with EDD domain
MATIALVTDTSSDLLPEQAAAAGIRLVPLTVSFGDDTYDAVTELSNEQFYEKLTAPGAPLPRTAAPNPAQFETAYREALEAGADGVVCITISQKLSATYTSAVQAAAALEPGLVEVLDSATTSHALGMVVASAAALGAAGSTMDDVIAHASDLIGRSELYFAVDTLEYLQRGGRIGRASALLGTMLSIKPILFVENGEVGTADKKRTAAKAQARLLELATARPVERATVLHTTGVDIEALRDRFVVAAGIDAGRVEVGLTGCVAGTHVGPGLYGVALILTA